MADGPGRPTLMTEETLAKLERAFRVGAGDIEACFVAGISTTTLYNYQKDNPEYVARKMALKEMTKYKARQNVAEAIENKDKALSQWFLERRAKDEFAQRTESTGKDGKDLIPESNKEVEAIASKLNELTRNNGTSVSGDGALSNALDQKVPD